MIIYISDFVSIFKIPKKFKFAYPKCAAAALQVFLNLQNLSMAKSQLKNHISHLCLLAFLSAFFWSCLFYFHFVVIDSSSEPKPGLNHPNPVPVDQGVTTRSPINDTRIERERLSEHDVPIPVPVKSRITTQHPINDTRIEKERLSENDERMQQSFPFMRALKTVENKSDPCGGRYIYVHELPSMFNEDMLKDCKSLSLWTDMCKCISNGGQGPPLDNTEGVFSETGWYTTNQFALEVIFRNRMKQYECLTNDSSLAAALFVPFFAGLDVARYLWGFNTSTRDAASLALVDWLVKRPEWDVMGGKDHFLVAGRITWDFRRWSDEDSDWGNKLLLLPAAKNMTMLVIESSPWSGSDYAIPYPTYFHPEKDDDVFTWQDRMRRLDREHLFCFAGGPRPGNPLSIRGQIINECKNSNACKLLACGLGQSKCHSPTSVMQMFQSSVFCLQPQGDSYTRRSAFDSMLAGCIPVFFHPGSAYVQYTWHLPKNYTTYSVFIPEGDILTKNVSIEQRLREIPTVKVKEMREEVINLIPRIIYSDPRSKMETLKDAFDVSVEAVIDKVTKMRRGIVEGKRGGDFIEEISWKYALLGEGQVGRPHEWDPFFSKPKNDDGLENSSPETAESTS